MTEKKTIVIGISGGIAAYKTADLVSRLKKRGYEVEVVMTEAAQELVAPLTFATLSGHPVHLDLFGEPAGEDVEVEHIAIAERADLLVIVPATANIMAKAVCGIADDLLSTLILAADSPVLWFPAMNTRMWEHDATQKNVACLRERGFCVVDPDEGVLACGSSGKGRLPAIDEIEKIIVETVEQKQPERDLEGRTFLISAGPTVEDIDPVRFLSNRSSGKMGYALAEAALRRGAEVHLVSGPVSLPCPKGVHIYNVRSALEMKERIEALYEQADCTIMAAAVADYRVKETSDRKIKKGEGDFELTLVRNPDILAELGKNKKGILVGFAAETEQLKENALKKLEAKNLDLIVANDVKRSDAGFGVDTNKALIFSKEGSLETEMLTKAALADVIIDEILKLKEF